MKEAMSLPPDGSPRRILVVDADDVLRRVTSEVLTNSGYEVDAAEDGAVAWSALQLFDYDLLITDNNLPHVSGIELLKKLHAAQMALPVIMASGMLPLVELERHPWLRIQAVLLKPFAAAQLLASVRNLLRVVVAGQVRFASRDGTGVGQSAISPTNFETNSLYRILVVDDDSDTRQLSMDVLEGSGYVVNGVKDGAAGWDALQADDYSLVITDNQMPRMTGIEMIEKLRASRSPVAVIMATRALPVREFARKPWLTPQAQLERPFTNAQLLASVKSVLH